MPPRSRSGSTKQLFKQQALDEDADMDENSLLLPTTSNLQQPPLNGSGSGTATASGSGTASGSATGSGSGSLNVSGSGDCPTPAKSDTADIMRIISERRRMDQRDQSGNEDSDYNELLPRISSIAHHRWTRSFPVPV